MKHRTRNRLTNREKEKIVILHKQGIRRRYIAERFGVTGQTITNVVRQGRERENKVSPRGVCE